ncbi:hypothetical protein [Listeria seeligeri]|uniref:hypothetical protein n=1 Tax=Listeria seeligeri TaxID=1640 RepID=UPI0022EB9CAB|nr:hypothetical protein [Listeria seeligeri]
MNAIIDVFQKLYNDNGLNQLMNQIRGTVEENQTIFQQVIDEDYKKREKAPLIRIESVDNSGAFYNDNLRGATNEQVQVSIMTQDLIDLQQLIEIVDELMKEIEFEQFSDRSYQEPDLSLQYAARSYQRINYK